MSAPIIPDARPGVIYAICHPTTGAVRYIGKAHDLKKRRRDHLNELRSGTHRNTHLQAWATKLGQPPAIRILQECLPGMMDQCEQEWIARGRAKGWKLCNHCEGGVGGPHSDETRAKLSEISKGKWDDPDYRRRHGEAMARARRTRPRKAKLAAVVQYGPTRNAWEKSRQRDARVWSKALVPLTYGGVAFVGLTHGKRATIDADDWTRASAYLWHATKKAGTETWRAKTSLGHGRCLLLNRFIARASETQMVRHRNRNQLDCRKGNLDVLVQVGGRPRDTPANCGTTAGTT
jgi:hypothetical protein